MAEDACQAIAGAVDVLLMAQLRCETGESVVRRGRGESRRSLVLPPPPVGARQARSVAGVYSSTERPRSRPELLPTLPSPPPFQLLILARPHLHFRTLGQGGGVCRTVKSALTGKGDPWEVLSEGGGIWEMRRRSSLSLVPTSSRSVADRLSQRRIVSSPPTANNQAPQDVAAVPLRFFPLQRLRSSLGIRLMGEVR